MTSKHSTIVRALRPINTTYTALDNVSIFDQFKVKADRLERVDCLLASIWLRDDAWSDIAIEVVGGHVRAVHVIY
jgi:hypothetical protein